MNSSIKHRNSNLRLNKDQSKVNEREKIYSSTGQKNIKIYIEDLENKLRVISKEKSIKTLLMEKTASKMAFLESRKKSLKNFI